MGCTCNGLGNCEACVMGAFQDARAEFVTAAKHAALLSRSAMILQAMVSETTRMSEEAESLAVDIVHGFPVILSALAEPAAHAALVALAANAPPTLAPIFKFLDLATELALALRPTETATATVQTAPSSPAK